MTIKDMAKLCGVSVSTVSRVLNDRPDVSPAVREAVLDAVRESNYVPNNSARSLVKTSSDAMGLVVRGVSNPFYSDIIKVIGREIDAAGYTMVMQQISPAPTRWRPPRSWSARRSCAGSSSSAGAGTTPPEELRTITVPFVCCSYTNSFGSLPRGSYSSVTIEDDLAAERAVDELCGWDTRRIACLVAETDDRSISELRYHGYLTGPARRTA